MRRVIFISGASRGIGRHIALEFAKKEKAAIIVTGKTAKPHPILEGTIHSVAEEIEKAGGEALPLVMDVREEDQIQAAMKKAVETFGGIDVLINNASAISLTDTLSTPMKRYDLMQTVNVRGSFACAQAAIPYLKQSHHAHILTLSPPISLNPDFWAPHFAYTYSKMGMSFLTLALAKELESHKISVNSLWPKTTIATDAMRHFPEAALNGSRTADIVAEAAYAICNTRATGQFFTDEGALSEFSGVTDFSGYALHKNAPLFPDLFL